MNSTKFFLLKFRADYAGEFDVCGFLILDQHEMCLFADSAIDFFTRRPHYDWYFGTNEFIEFDGYDQYMNLFDITELDEKQYDSMLELFPNKLFGHFPCAADFYDDSEEENDDGND